MCKDVDCNKTANFLVSDEGESSSESRELLTSLSESDNMVDVYYLRKLLPHWKMLFPWAECEEGEMKEYIVKTVDRQV